MDFEALLGFVEDGVQSTGKYHLLPMARLFELDKRMTNPLRPRLKRPQQKSFPHLNGLYLLLRATQLGVPEGHGKANGRLTLDSTMHKQWPQLNATERYFNLLESWLRRSSWEAVVPHQVPPSVRHETHQIPCFQGMAQIACQSQAAHLE